MDWTRPAAGKYENPGDMYSPALWKYGVSPDERQEGAQRLMAMGWFFDIFIFSLILSWYRTEARLGSGIGGNLVEDYVLSLFLYPMVILQIEEQMKIPLNWSGPYYVLGSEAHKNFAKEEVTSSGTAAVMDKQPRPK